MGSPYYKEGEPHAILSVRLFSAGVAFSILNFAHSRRGSDTNTAFIGSKKTKSPSNEGLFRGHARVCVPPGKAQARAAVRACVRV